MKHKGQKLIIDDRLTLQACIAKKMKVKDISIRLSFLLIFVITVLKRMYMLKKDTIMILPTQII